MNMVSEKRKCFLNKVLRMQADELMNLCKPAACLLSGEDRESEGLRSPL